MANIWTSEQQKIQWFYNRHFTYVNQIFGHETIRNVILTEIGIDKKAIGLIFGDDGSGGRWEHHVAYDLSTQPPKMLCSAEMGFQDSVTADTACQSYSLYNAILYNKHMIKSKYKDIFLSLRALLQVTDLFGQARVTNLHHNTFWMCHMYQILLSIPKITNRIEKTKFTYFDHDIADGIIVSDDLTDKIENLAAIIAHWREYGYRYFLQLDGDNHVRCQALTKAGKRCSYNAADSLGLCNRHNRKIAYIGDNTLGNDVALTQ